MSQTDIAAALDRGSHDGLTVVIAGSRALADDISLLPCSGVDVVQACLDDAGLDPDEIVSGTAHGPDTFGEHWAAQHSDCRLTRMPAPWDEFRADPDRSVKGAGFWRNEQMARYADAAVIIWTGDSPGSQHMIQQARSHIGAADTFVYNYRNHELPLD
jgi:hypothetical protein